jgi:hypothetical protein
MAMLNNQRVDEKKTDDARFLLLATYISTKSFTCFAYGGFLRCGHPQIIHFGRIFHEINHPAIWGTPMAMESPKLIGHQKNSTDMFTVHHLELGIQLLSARAGSDGCYNPMVQFFFSPTFQPQHPPGANPGYGCNVLELKKRNHGWYTARN